MESKSNLGLSISYYVTPETPILGGLLALPGVPAPTVCACAFNFVHFSHCLLFLQLSFDVVCQVEEERDGICGAGCCGGGSTAAKDKSKNLLCRSGRGVVRWLAGKAGGKVCWFLSYSAPCADAYNIDVFSIYCFATYLQR